MVQRITVSHLQIAKALYELVDNEIAPEVGVESTAFWQSFSEILTEMVPENEALLAKRRVLQEKLNEWHSAHKGVITDAQSYRDFLRDIGYLVEEGPDFQISTENVDPEVSTIAGPQLVVPVNNARYALNASNARWGSLYDAVYGSDIIGDEDGAGATASYNPLRGQKVVALVMDFLDKVIPLEQGSHALVKQYSVDDSIQTRQLKITLTSGENTGLKNPAQFAGYDGNSDARLILFRNNELHIQLLIDRDKPVGKGHPAGINDVILESAITTIEDCEDSVAAVDAEDKIEVYRNWLGLMRGDLRAEFEKGGDKMIRTLNADKQFTGVDGNTFTLPGRSLLFVRNVGNHMMTDAVLDAKGNEIPETMLDAMMTTLIALYDLQDKGRFKNSRAGSMYVVKPKLHGPEEVASAIKLFDRVESALGLTKNTIKIGVMDEERRTTVNLKECIRAASERLVFINTGFLDRTGDEIHSAMEAGPYLPKADIKNQPWIAAYEDWNVDIGLACGLQGKAQIGKGMWAMPDLMKAMLDTKIIHPEAGANTAWVPSPTAASIHAMHYHLIDVTARQDELKSRQRADLDKILTLPLLNDPSVLQQDDVENELNNNAQSILGYVVRWIDQGVGCSKVPDISDVGLMEDRATLRISSQHIANWLYHGICTEEQVTRAFKNMALVVDKQNAGDPNYEPMAPDYDGIAFRAALALALEGREQANGYTEFLLTRYRREKKSTAA